MIIFRIIILFIFSYVNYITSANPFPLQFEIVNSNEPVILFFVSFENQKAILTNKVTYYLKQDESKKYYLEAAQADFDITKYTLVEQIDKYFTYTNDNGDTSYIFPYINGYLIKKEKMNGSVIDFTKEIEIKKDSNFQISTYPMSNNRGLLSYCTKINNKYSGVFYIIDLVNPNDTKYVILAAEVGYTSGYLPCSSFEYHYFSSETDEEKVFCLSGKSNGNIYSITYTLEKNVEVFASTTLGNGYQLEPIAIINNSLLQGFGLIYD